MQLAEWFQEIFQAGALGFYLSQRLVRLLHLPDSIRKRGWVDTRHQLYIALVTVITKPVVGALLSVSIHRQKDVIVQAAVLGEVLEYAFDGEFQIGHVLVINHLADALLHTAQLLGETPAHHDSAPFPQNFHRVTDQNRSVKDLEKAGIGADQRGLELVAVFVKVGIAIEDKRGARATFNARDLFHKAHGHGTAHLAIVLLIPLHGDPGVDGVHPVDVLVEAVVTQLKEHLGNEHDAHCQPDAQGEDLD